MNIIEEIKTIRQQVDFLVELIKGETMINPSVLQAELDKFQALSSKSKLVIASLKSKIAEHENTIKIHESTIASQMGELQNISTVANTVVALSSKFTDSFNEFEAFLNSIGNTVVAPVSANVETSVVVENIVTPSLVSSDPHADPVTRIGPLVQ